MNWIPIDKKPNLEPESNRYSKPVILGNCDTQEADMLPARWDYIYTIWVEANLSDDTGKHFVGKKFTHWVPYPKCGVIEPFEK